MSSDPHAKLLGPGKTHLRYRTAQGFVDGGIILAITGENVLSVADPADESRATRVTLGSSSEPSLGMAYLPVYVDGAADHVVAFHGLRVETSRHRAYRIGDETISFLLPL